MPLHVAPAGGMRPNGARTGMGKEANPPNARKFCRCRSIEPFAKDMQSKLKSSRDAVW